MSTVKLYRETLCEHGETKPHGQPPHPEAHLSDAVWCSGGSRETVTIDYEAAALLLIDGYGGPADVLAKRVVAAALGE